MLVPQVLLATASGALVAMPMLLSVIACLFVSVTDLAALVLPATVVLKLRLVTERVTGAMPVPDRLTLQITVTNIGEGGVGITSVETVRIGGILSFRLRLPELKNEISVQARVLWTRRYG